MSAKKRSAESAEATIVDVNPFEPQMDRVQAAFKVGQHGAAGLSLRSPHAAAAV